MATVPNSGPDSRPPAETAPYERLKALLRGMGKVVVAYSGGVDSSLLLAAAHDALGERALAVTACSPTYPGHEREQAVALARELGARHELIDSHEVEDESYRRNPTNRCYYCKQELFSQLREIAAREGGAVILDGYNADDRGDYRPGHQAAREAGVRSPLAELGFGKEEIRRMARERGLSNWDQPPHACLASRIPYGEQITPERLDRIAAAEEAIRALGFRLVRVRDHGELARVEIAADEIERPLTADIRRDLARACKRQGYTWVCLDLEGYRTGAMNEALREPAF